MNALQRLWDQLEEAAVAFLLGAMTLVTFSYVVFNNLYGVFYALGDALPFANDAMFAIGDSILYI
ncbi:C4-dicarboxylate ABC transporter, partial [Pseudomonas sp. PDM12]|nr:C4-dicarboxylate ABC transporter [Pseudomonas sp. PDM12]